MQSQKKGSEEFIYWIKNTLKLLSLHKEQK